jgi:hypothetical protein
MSKIILAVAIYTTAYVEIMKPSTEIGICSLGYFYYERLPTYPTGGKWAEFLFFPAYCVDEKIRPGFWRGSREVGLEPPTPHETNP